MAKANFVKKARKAIPEAGIAKGDSYWWWQHFRRAKQVSKAKPKPSQLEGSAFLSTLMEIGERFDDPQCETPEDLQSLVEDAVGDLNSLSDETQGSFDNMPEGLQQGETGQLLESRVESLSGLIGELEGLDYDVEEEDGETDEKKAARKKVMTEGLLSEIQGFDWSGG